MTSPIEIPFIGYRNAYLYQKQALEDEGISVPMLRAPIDVIGYLDANSPRVIISTLDFESRIGLPEDADRSLNGAQVALETMKLVRRMPNFARTPIVILDSWNSAYKGGLEKLGPIETIDIFKETIGDFVERVRRKLK